MKLNKDEVINYINDLKNFRGYVQFSHRAINIQKDVFMDKDPIVEKEEGFIYEAHFASNDEYVIIKQLNNNWLVDRGELKNIENKVYYAIAGIKVKMAQIWEEEVDDLCEGMLVKKLKKVVFAGFQGDKK